MRKLLILAAVLFAMPAMAGELEDAEARARAFAPIDRYLRTESCKVADSMRTELDRRVLIRQRGGNVSVTVEACLTEFWAARCKADLANSCETGCPRAGGNDYCFQQPRQSIQMTPGVALDANGRLLNK
jgi:hypothetical protein